jgi:hypothetical protein
MNPDYSLPDWTSYRGTLNGAEHLKSERMLELLVEG